MARGGALAALSARELVAEALARHLRPPPDVPVDEWAERHRWLEKRTSAAAGPWRNAKTPYLIEPQRCWTDPRVRNVVLLKGGQTGGSEIALNCVGRDIECDPGPTLWVTSSDEQVRKISRRRIGPMLDRPPLRSRVPRLKGREAGRTTTSIEFEQGSLSIVTAHSPASLSSDPARRVIFDEVDRYSESSGTEGDPLDLGKARQQTFELYGAKTLFVSTPGIEGVSRIAKLYEDSDQRRYMVPCPECGTLQELVWFGTREDGHKFGVLWDHAAPKHLAAKTAYYQCEHCPARWDDAQRWAQVQPEAGAQWVATRPFAGTAGFYIPSLLSTFVRLSDCVATWFAAQGRPSKLQAFWNLVLGLPWSLTAESAPKRIPLEAWEGFDVPESACLLLGMADVQANRIEVTIAGLAPNEQVLPVEHRIFQGSTELPQVWDDVEAYIGRQWSRSDGRGIRLTALGIDCSYKLETVCDWAAQVAPRTGLRVFPLRGVSRGVKQPIVRERVPSPSKGGRWFYNVNADAAKLAVIQKLQLKASQPGCIRYPARECFTDGYFEQLRAETLKRRYVRGFLVLEWHLRAGQRNEALDCLAGILAVREWLNPALDVLATRNPKITAEPVAPAPALPAELPRDRDALEAMLARLLEQREAARAAAPPPPPPRVATRSRGAWFDAARGPRR